MTCLPACLPAYVTCPAVTFIVVVVDVIVVVVVVVVVISPPATVRTTSRAPVAPALSPKN